MLLPLSVILCIFFSLYIDPFVIVYLDDIVVYSQTLEEHVEHLRLVLAKLREHELYLKQEKCSFAQTEIPFLGHRIGHGQVARKKSKGYS